MHFTLTTIKCPYFPDGEERTLTVLLPEDAAEPEKRHPVLYLFDGQMLLPEAAEEDERGLGLRAMLETLHEPVIAVGIPCAADDRRRLREYCPAPVALPGLGMIDGRGADTAQSLVENIKPMIDNAFPTLPDRDNTYVAGISLGAAEALYTALHYSAVFSRAAALSPAITPILATYRDEAAKLPENTEGRVWISWGEHEMPKQALTGFAAALEQINAELKYHGYKTNFVCRPDGWHTPMSWRVCLPDMLSFLLG